LNQNTHVGLKFPHWYIRQFTAENAKMKNFEGKVVFITGAGSGIGRATALALVAAGALAGWVDCQV
jgi:hypothetical protein